MVLPEGEIRRSEAQGQESSNDGKPYEGMPPSGGKVWIIRVSTTHAFTESLVATSGPTKRRKLRTAYVHFEQFTIQLRW